MLVIAKNALAADNIQEEDVGVAFSDNVTRWGIIVAAFATDVIRREDWGVAFADNIIR